MQRGRIRDVYLEYNRNDSNLLNVLSGVGQGECGGERSQGGGRTGLKIGYCFPL